MMNTNKRPLGVFGGVVRGWKNQAVVIGAALVLGLAGCATTGERSEREKATALSELHSFYVVRSDHEAHGIDRVIVNELDLLGLEATSGPASAQPAGVDGKITYLAKWVDNDLFKLEIEIRPMAKGAKMVHAGSYLQRKQPSGMVHELLEVLLPPRKVEKLKK